MAKNKTTETQVDVTGFINSVQNETRRNESFRLIELFKEATGYDPKMWGPTIIGFGTYHYKYASGHEGDAPLAGFAPRKNAIVLYLWPDFEARETLLERFGKFKMSKACIYVRKLEDVDTDILKKMLPLSIAKVHEIYPS